MKLQKKKLSFFIQPTVNGKVVSVPLGKDRKVAKALLDRIETLLNHQRAGLDYPVEVKTWIKKLDSTFSKLLVSKGILDEKTGLRFPGLFKKFMESYDDKTREQSTITRMNRSNRIALEVFKNVPLDKISPSIVARYESALKKNHPSSSTWGKSLSDTKQVFNWGISRNLIESNPIKHLKGNSRSNPDRMEYVKASDIEKIISSCSPDYRTIFALARFSGLRIPSELARLEFVHIDREKETLQVYAPKTKSWRLVPIFPPLDKYLNEAFEDAAIGQLFPISDTSKRQPESNLRSQGIDFIQRAGYEPWPKLFQNLRASCATDWVNTGYVITEVASWMGHSVKVLMDHYKMMTGSEIETARKLNSNPFQISEP